MKGVAKTVVQTAAQDVDNDTRALFNVQFQRLENGDAGLLQFVCIIDAGDFRIVADGAGLRRRRDIAFDGAVAVHFVDFRPI